MGSDGDSRRRLLLTTGDGGGGRDGRSGKDGKGGRDGGSGSGEIVGGASYSSGDDSADDAAVLSQTRRSTSARCPCPGQSDSHISLHARTRTTPYL